MAEVKHTSGEWRLDTAPSGRAYGVSAVTPLGLRVPVVVWRGIAKPASDKGQANARLLAAAPDLLAVAIKSHEPYEGLSEDDIRSLYGPEEAELALSLRAALSKATTQQEGR